MFDQHHNAYVQIFGMHCIEGFIGNAFGNMRLEKLLSNGLDISLNLSKIFIIPESVKQKRLLCHTARLYLALMW